MMLGLWQDNVRTGYAKIDLHDQPLDLVLNPVPVAGQ